MPRRQHFRDVTEWQNDGLTLTTPSNEAAKLYDAALTQIIGWYDDPHFDGLVATLHKLSCADTNFVRGQSLNLAMGLLTTAKTTRVDAELATAVDNLEKLAVAQKDVITNEEFQHAMAVVDWSKGDLISAANRLENILITNPLDLHALKFAYDTYLWQGKSNQIRDSVARVLPEWESKKPPLYSYMYGMHAFGLEESYMYRNAEIAARKGLEINELDCWSTHALAHIFEMEGRVDESLPFLNSTSDAWSQGKYLACHNYWHVALNHIEKGEPEAAVEILEAEIMPRSKESQAVFNLCDFASLAYRLELIGEEVGIATWNEAFAIAEPHLEDAIIGFNDAHFMMTCMGAKKYDSAKILLSNLENGRNSHYGAPRVAQALLEAVGFYERERYDETVNHLLPIKYEIIQLGGSHAQRDVFNQLLISAALRSSSSEHQKLAIQLINERKSIKDLSVITDRMQLNSGNK